MDKLRTLQASSWSDIDAQADIIFKTIKEHSGQGQNWVVFTGALYQVNKAILLTNGFMVKETAYNFEDERQTFTVSWDGNSLSQSN